MYLSENHPNSTLCYSVQKFKHFVSNEPSLWGAQVNGYALIDLSALKSQTPEIFHNQKLGLALEQRPGFSILKGQRTQLGAGGGTTCSCRHGWLEDGQA